MGQVLKSGSTGDSAEVTRNHRLEVRAVTLSIHSEAANIGEAYAITSGVVSLTSSTESGLLYFLNDEAPSNGVSSIHIDEIVVGLGKEAAAANIEIGQIRIVTTPTAGTLISALAAATKSNRSLGSSNALSTTSVAYLGVEGSTITDGTDYGWDFVEAGSVRVIQADILLPRGASIAILLDPGVSAGTSLAFATLNVHRVQAT